MSENSDKEPVLKKITVNTLRDIKRAGEKFACLTAYDASFAALLDSSGIEVILVGDSLGMVVQGKETTVPVTMDDMVYHCRNVARGCRHALLMADMPFMSYASPEQALRNAARLMQQGGAHMVKLEGGDAQVEIVARLTQQGIPVCAHLGLKPQSVHKMGGFKVQGRKQEIATAMIIDAGALQEAGADVLLLECVPDTLAQEITQGVDVPVIGIGAGPHCDAQILVLYDMLGITQSKVPRFVHNFLQDQNSVQDAVRAYIEAIKEGRFPAEKHTFQ